jgi:hypothetical protein
MQTKVICRRKVLKVISAEQMCVNIMAIRVKLTFMKTCVFNVIMIEVRNVCSLVLKI